MIGPLLAPAGQAGNTDQRDRSSFELAIRGENKPYRDPNVNLNRSFGGVFSGDVEGFGKL